MPASLFPSFLVNQFTDGDQLAPSVTRLDDGRFVVVWLTGDVGPGSEDGVFIRGRLFDADGTPIGDEFAVNTSTGGIYSGLDDVEPSVAALKNGGFVVAWANKFSTHDADRSATAVRAQAFSAEAEKVGAEFRVNTTTPDEQERAVVATLSNGRFVVAWQDYSFAASAPDNRPPAVKAQLFTEGGTRIGGEFLVNTTTPGAQYQPDIAPLSGGGFVVVWQDESLFSVALRAQVFGADGQRVGSERTLFSINDYRTQSFGADPKVTALGDGGFAVTWWHMNGSVRDVTVQRYDAAGNVAGAPITIRPAVGDVNAWATRPVIATTEDGRLIVVHAEEDRLLYARLFRPDGTPDGAAFPVLDDTQASRMPDITALDGSRFLVAYERTSPFSDFRGDDSGSSVRARIVDAGPPDQIQRAGTPGNDTMQGGSGADTLIGLDGDDVLSGLDGDDSLAGDGGADRVDGGAGNDMLAGGDGADTLNGGDGDDVIRGGASAADLRDVIYAGEGDDSVDAGHGNDLIYGGGGNDTVEGGFGVDEIIGQAGNDVLTGSAFSDLIFGGAGDDFVNGGFGSDRVNGGAGADRFYHLGIADHGSDWIQDYDAAQGDRLVFGGAATRAQFQVNLTETAGAGQAGVDEAFVIYRPTGQILWALVDGGAQASINLQIGGQVYDLLA